MKNHSAPRAQKGAAGGARFISVAAGSALLMDLMDSAALATALPTLADDFGVSAVDMRLALTAYFMTVAVLVPVSGWLSNRFGAKRVFVSAICVFVTGSICCGLAQSIEMLVAARVLQGVGGSMMTPVGRSLVVSLSEKKDLVRALGWFTMPVVLGPLLGPPLAGVLIEFASWRWIFFINAPIGLIGAVAVLCLAPNSVDNNEDREPFDGRGFAMLGLGLVLLLLAIEGVALDPLLRMGVLIMSVSLLSAYARHALSIARPIVDLRLFRHVSLRMSAIAGFFMRMFASSIPFVLALLLQSALGFSPIEMAYVMIGGACGTFLSRWIAPPLVNRIGFKPALMVCAGLAAVFGLSTLVFRADTSIFAMGALVATASIFRGAFLITNTTLGYAELEKREVPHASVLLSIGQQLSAGAGVTIVGVLITAVNPAPAPLTAIDFVAPLILMSFLGVAALVVISILPRDIAHDLRKPPQPDALKKQ